MVHFICHLVFLLSGLISGEVLFLVLLPECLSAFKMYSHTDYKRSITVQVTLIGSAKGEEKIRIWEIRKNLPPYLSSLPFPISFLPFLFPFFLIIFPSYLSSRLCVLPFLENDVEFISLTVLSDYIFYCK